MDKKVKVIWFVFAVLMAIGASTGIASAQAQDEQKPSPSWTFGVDFAPGSWVKSSGLGESIGSVRLDQVNDPYVGGHFGYKPNSGLGGEFRYMQFGTVGDSAGSVAQTTGTVILWGANDTPHIVSTAPILNGPVAYTIESDAKISRSDLLGNYNFAIRRGWVSVFGGMPILRVEATEEVTRAQGFLLYARLPNGNLGTVGNRENYAYASTTSAKATLIGLTGGVEGEYCIVSRLIVHSRVALAVFPWGNTEGLLGQFTALKDVYLVNVAGGLTATPTSTLAHLNLPGANYVDSNKETVTALDGQIGLKWRFRAGNARFDLGGAITGLSLNNLPLAPSYVIHDGFAPGNGMFMPRPTKVSLITPMLTIGVWF